MLFKFPTRAMNAPRSAHAHDAATMSVAFPPFVSGFSSESEIGMSKSIEKT